MGNLQIAAVLFAALFFAATGTAQEVWREPSVPIEQFDFLTGEKGLDAFDLQTEVICKWRPKPISGRTPKFICMLPNGDLLKVKYHTAAEPNPEVPAEIVASRLLRALGFGADRMYTAKTVRCSGCPEQPFQAACNPTEKP